MDSSRAGRHELGRRNRIAQGGSQELPFEFTGGWLCLDFANTVSKRPTYHPQDRLTSFPRLVAWSHQAHIVSDREAQRLIRAGICQSEAAAEVLERAIGLREVIYRIFSAIAAGRQPVVVDLSKLNVCLAEAMVMARIVSTPNGYAWGWQDTEDALDRTLWPVARSAADLLASDGLVAVRDCVGRTCRWLFMDNSRNQSRRWCDMKVCGNRAKAHWHYERTKAGRRKPQHGP
ncbi:MAG: ABATE domain-containing protein [Deltaproteobacteria bacterium]|nr:ABATE domain-containing protein [Deltaproteobacteria bacterium]